MNIILLRGNLGINYQRFVIGTLLLITIGLSYYFILDSFLFFLLFTIIIYDLKYSNLLKLRNIITFFIITGVVFFVVYHFGVIYLAYINLLFFIILLFNFFTKKSLFNEIFILLITLFLFSLVYISHIDRNLVYLIILISFLNDTIAFIVGKNFKGPLILKKISPKKTWSGTTISLIFSSIFLYLLNFSIFLSFILSLSLFFGDIYFSYIKRIIKIKDFSNIFPGHGGILDRVDSMSLFSLILFISITL